MKQLILDLIPKPKPKPKLTLDNFVPDRNGESLEALLDAASGVPSAKIIHWWGSTRRGKSQ